MNKTSLSHAGSKYGELSLEEFLLSNSKFYELSLFYRAQKKYIKTSYYLKQEILRSDSVAYKINLADCYIEQKCFEQALLFLNQVIDSIKVKKIFYYSIHLLKLECLVNLNEHCEALDIIQKLSKSFELEEEIFAWQGIIHLKMNDFEKAKTSYTKCLAFNPNLEKAWLGLGSVHCIKGDFELGISCFKKTLDINSENIAAQNFLLKYSQKVI